MFTDDLLFRVLRSSVTVGAALFVAMLLLSFYDHTIQSLRQRLNLAVVVGVGGFFVMFFVEALSVPSY